MAYAILWRYGAIESRGGRRIVFDAVRLFFKTMRAIGFYSRKDEVFAIGETIKMDRVVDGSGKMSL
jgi:catabolite regulation protein CreA